jgi:3-hydroxy-4-methylanthranilate adenylyltransferase
MTGLGSGQRYSGALKKCTQVLPRSNLSADFRSTSEPLDRFGGAVVSVQVPAPSPENPEGAGWVDEILLAGPDDQVCLHLGRPVTRAELRVDVRARQEALAGAGITAGGSVALRLPPSYAYIVNLLACLRIGAQAALLDHRLTEFEAQVAYERLLPQLIVTPAAPVKGALRAFHEVTEVDTPYAAGRPSATGAAILQLSSGSTGPSKVIGRSARSLIDEVERYTRMKGVPLAGERVVLLASMVHVLGLVGGLLYGLHAGVELVLPDRMTVDEIFDAIAMDERPTTLIGVPFHIELLAGVAEPPKLPQLIGMTTGGELVRADVRTRFTERYPIRLGNMYGMTEVGVIATDLFGEHRPSVTPAPGIEVRERDGEVQIRMAASPYVGLIDPSRWEDGWLHTKDAGTVDPDTGLVTIHGRLDSQVSVGGLKVDLTEVEHILAGLDGVEGAVVVHTGAIEAYVVVSGPEVEAVITSALTERLAPYKRPRVVHYVDQLPRTVTGKLVRSAAALASSAGATTGSAPSGPDR